MKYRRIILKLSGEALLSPGTEKGISLDAAAKLVSEVRSAIDLGVEIGIVIGGGNIFRGAPAAKEGGICQAQADRMGMLATVINGLALQEVMIGSGLDAVLMSSLAIEGVAHSFDRRSAIRDMKEGRVLIFCGGTGSPFFRPTPPHLFALLRSVRRLFSRGPRSTGSIPPIRRRILPRSVSIPCHL